MAYTIVYTRAAQRQLSCLNRYYYNLVKGAIDQQLIFQPTVETRNRKPLRSNPLGATWELRVPPYRVYYRVEQDAVIVEVIAVGYKPGSEVIIDGEEVDL